MSPHFDAILGQPHDPHYCARCLTPVGRRDRACGGCDLPFEGCGRFHRLSGLPPAGAATSPPLERAAA
jgi:hypothetical protein